MKPLLKLVLLTCASTWFLAANPFPGLRTLATAATGDAALLPATSEPTPAVTVTSIAPDSASYGESITITGNGFGGPNVSIRVGGVPALVVSATGSRATFRVPVGVPVGTTTITVTNPGGRTGSIGFDLNGHITLALDEATRVQRLIGPAGGALTTSSNGRTYVLTIPAGALIANEAIVMTPVAGMAGLPLDTLLGAVHFSPEGLQFAKPATLTITLPPGANTHGFVAFSAAGNGQNLHLTSFAAGPNATITIPVSHFSVAGGGTASPLAAGAIQCISVTTECVYGNALALEQVRAEQTICGSDCATPADLASHEFAIESAWALTEIPLIRQWFDEVLSLWLDGLGAIDDPGLQLAGHEFEAWRGWVNAYPCGGADCADLPDIAADITTGDDHLAADYREAFTRAHARCDDRRVADLIAEVVQLGLLGKGGLPSDQASLQAAFACQLLITAALPATVHPGDSIPFTVKVEVQVLGLGVRFPPSAADVTIRITSGCGFIGGTGSTARTLNVTAGDTGIVSTQIQIPSTCGSSGGVQQITVTPQNATVAPGGTLLYRAQVAGGGTTEVEVAVADIDDPVYGFFALGRSTTLATNVERLARVTWTAGGGTITQGQTPTATYTAGSTPGIFGVTATSVDDPSQSQTVAVTINGPSGGTNAQVFISTDAAHPGLVVAFIYLYSPGGPVSSQEIQLPINDFASLTGNVTAAIAGASKIDVFSIQLFAAPLTLSFNLPAPTVGNLTVATPACGSNVTVTARDVGLIIAAPECNSTVTLAVQDVRGQTTVRPKNSTVTLTARNMGTNGNALFIGCVFFGCQTVQSSTVKVQADSMATLAVTANNSDITVIGQMRNSVNPNQQGIYIQNNTNTKLTAQLAGDLSFFLLDNNTFTSPPQISVGDETVARNFNFTDVGLVSIEHNNGLALSGITGLNTIDGSLIIANNSGFSDDDANEFVKARTVKGEVFVGNNAR